MILISACLYGLPCRYDGGCRASKTLCKRLAGNALLICCPEQLGALPTPRPRAELRGGDGKAVLAGTARVVRPESGEDVTEEFVRGAERTVALAKHCGVTHAILKSKSPSCGVAFHYEDDILVSGPGVTTAALLKAGILVEECDG